MTKQEFIKAVQDEFAKFGLPVGTLNAMQIVRLYKDGKDVESAYRAGVQAFNA